MMILLVGVSPMLSTWATALLLMLLILDRIRTYRRLAHIPGPLSGSFSGQTSDLSRLRRVV